jgi:hypothetical protein
MTDAVQWLILILYQCEQPLDDSHQTCIGLHAIFHAWHLRRKVLPVIHLVIRSSSHSHRRMSVDEQHTSIDELLIKVLIRAHPR